jgi:hypothetical protein
MAKANSHAQGAGNLDDDTISRVGKALRQMSAIKDDYSQRLASAATEEERVEAAEKAQSAALEALGDQGLSVERYDQVLTAAEDDGELEQRLLQAARAA